MQAHYLIGFLLLVGNWTLPPFGVAGSWVLILWSVSVEEQFYLSWPLFAKRASRAAMFAISIGLIVLAQLTRLYLCWRGIRMADLWPNTFAHIDAIGLGILFALIFQNAPRFRTRVRLALAAGAIIALIACGSFGDDGPALATLSQFWLGTAASAALFLSVIGAELNFAPLVHLGKISYGLYVYHTLSLGLVATALGGKTGTVVRFASFFFGSLALTLILASLSYRILEAPFLRLKERFSLVQSRPV